MANQPNDFRAAWWIAADGQSSVCLTTAEQATLPEAELLAAAAAEVAAAGLTREDGDSIEISGPAYTHTVSDYPLGSLPDVGDEVLVCDEHGAPERLAVVTAVGSIQTGNPMTGGGNSLSICIGDADRDWDDLTAAEQDRLYQDLHHV